MRRNVLASDGRVGTFQEQETIFNELIQQLALNAKYSGIPISKYELLDNSYRASGGFETGDYLIPHTSEKADKYARRKNMSYYINYVKPVVDSHVNPIFKIDPTRSGMSDIFSLFTNDVDGNNTTLSRFMKKAAIRAKLHGVEFIVVDMEKVDKDEIVTKKDVVDKRLYPYLYLVSPSQITDWRTDKFGRLVSISYTVSNNVVDKNGDVKTTSETWTWTKNICKRVIDGKEEQVENPVGIIPIIPLYGAINDSNELIPQSDVYAIARTNFALYNACSELRERNRAQAFSLLTYPISSEDDYESGDEPIKYGTADCLLYRAETGVAPKFITPPSDSSDIIMNEINFCIKEIYRMANLQMVTGVHQYNVSGIAKEWDSLQLFQTIGELAQGLQEAEQKIAKVFSKYTEVPMESYSVIYNTQYGVVDTTETLANATAALTMNISEDYNAEMKRQVIRATLKDADSRVVDTILTDFNKNPEKGVPLEAGQTKVVQPTA